ncbi:tripartite tricarboxylate transporter TctB family protein [Subtercola sp. PAMC28395]|uniref:tripartite tricarboxylate transporter TctB family protein n=1 Tax=Subtercola sp. PAMC28395 TaxID=2846775 RepID=UPI001C0BF472|nr:tripartite tricarboxylate transporter TctB family protein [Subtercola sp. PAMC28395]QWT24527.1 tripartite tricarboxylate transporter TctB family protein [Subtercola sp. PAMC28395]
MSADILGTSPTSKSRGASAARAATRLPTWLRGRSELGVAALLATLAIVIGFDTAHIRRTAVNAGVMGPQVVPTIIAIGLGVCSIALTVSVLRGGRAAAEEGEDIDLTLAAHWPTVFGLAGVILAYALTLDFLGFVVSSALLFYGSALLLGSRRFVWALVIGVLLAVGVFYGFVLGLGIPLPAGVLTGIL